MDTDLTSWQFWWEFNNAPFLNLRDAIHSGGALSEEEEFFAGDGRRRERLETLAPSETMIRDRIVPALVAQLSRTDDRDITSSCIIALAKIGVQPESTTLRDLFGQRLESRDQEIQETAALALGLAHDESTVPDLIAVATDSELGRKLCDETVDDRTRSFATYALGLIAHATTDESVRETIADTLLGLLPKKRIADRNQPVSTILALGLLHPSPGSEGIELRAKVVEALLEYYERDLGTAAQVLQAHVPTSIARLFKDAELTPGLDEDLHEKCRNLFLRDLRGQGKKDQYDIPRSCALALAQMSGPNDGRVKGGPATPRQILDREISNELKKASIEARDHQTRYFAMIGLGRQGGLENRDFLLHRLRSSKSTVERPWPALALGVLAHEAIGEEGTRPAPAVAYIGEQLEKQLDTKSPEVLGGVSTALGLARHDPVANRLQELLKDQSNNDSLAGHISIALALIGDQTAIPLLRELVQQSTRREERLRAAAIALGKLGDKHAQQMLLDMLTEDDRPGVQKMAALSSALVLIGDRESVEPLIETLENEEMTPLARAFAAVALGGIADKEPLPWNAKLSVGLNYRAAVDTLTGASTGVLDIF